VVARPPSVLYRARKSIVRNKVTFAAGFAVVLALLVGLVATAWQSAARQRTVVEQRRTLYVAQIQAAHRAWDQGNIAQARVLLRAQLPKAGEEDLRGFEWRYLWKLCRDQSSVTISNIGRAQVISIGLSTDGRFLASGDHLGGIRVWETDTWGLHRTLTGHANTVLSLEYDAKGRWLISGSVAQFRPGTRLQARN
jgi:hypothetical protein